MRKLDRPAVPPGLALLVAVGAMSWAGPLVRFAAAPALVIVAWRLIFSLAMIAPMLVFRREGLAGTRLRPGEWALAILAGVLLAGHFWAWITSVSLTTVSSSVVLVSTQPIFVAIFSVLLLGERPTGAQWAGILGAVAGAAVIGWGGLGRGTLLGDLLALTGAVLAAGYYIVGRRLRARLDVRLYVGIVYAIAAIVAIAIVLATPDLRMTGHPRSDWLVFLGLAAGPTMLGHTAVNYALRYLPAYLANLTVLGEPVGATLIAWLLPAIGEAPPPQTLVGGALIIAGIALGFWPKGRTRSFLGRLDGSGPARPGAANDDPSGHEIGADRNGHTERKRVD